MALKTPEGRVVPIEQIAYDEELKPYTFEWYDGEETFEAPLGAEYEALHDTGLDALDPTTVAKRVTPEEEALSALSGNYEDDNEQINRLKPIREAWRPMVCRDFVVDVQDTVVCVCRKWVPNISVKTGKELKSGKWVADSMCRYCAGRGKYKSEYRTETQKRWARLQPFKASKDQLIRYMNWRRHKVPENRKTRKPTTAAKEIDRLAKKTGDSLYLNVLVRRAVDKVDSTYTLGWAPWEDGRVHSEFAYGPASGQLNSRGPNVQNPPKHIRYDRLKPLDLPKKFRRLIKARPGHRIVEFDYKSFHILTLGFNARDPIYMRMARLDMHSYFSSHMLCAKGVLAAPIDFGLSDSDLKSALSDLKAASYLRLDGTWQRATKDHEKAYGILDAKGKPSRWNLPHGSSIIVKELRDQQAKPAILGKGLAMSAFRLYQENLEYFASQSIADEVMKTYDRTFPKEIEFQKMIAAKAHTDKYLVSRHGFIRRFWDVWHFLYFDDGTHEARPGDDYEASIAFHVQNDAFGHIRDAMVQMWNEGLCESVELRAVTSPAYKGLTLPTWMAPPDCSLKFQNWIQASQLINTVHDSLVFEMPDAVFDKCAPAIKEIMERKSKILVDLEVAPEGLWCEVEASAGPTWADMVEITI